VEPSSTPAGTSTVYARSSIRRPWPLQSAQGVGISCPDPPQRGHGLEVTIWPSRDCRTRRSSPVPWQVVQVTAVVPGLAPEPEQVSQVIGAHGDFLLRPEHGLVELEV